MKVALAVASTLVAALMVVQVVSMSVCARPTSMYVVDREGDLGKIFYVNYQQGSHPPGDPYSWWSGESPIGNAGYLDIVMGWMVVDRKTLTLGMQVASPITGETSLPEGIKAVQWSWFFTPTPTEWYWKWEVLIFWNGLDTSAFLVDREALPYVVTPLGSFAVSGTMLTVQVDAAILKNQVGWFFETTAYQKPWTPLTGDRPMGGWGSPDVTDLSGDPKWFPNIPLP